VTPETTVYLIEVAWDERSMCRLISQAKRVVAIDHHISSEETLKNCRKYADSNNIAEKFEYVFDADHSAAVLVHNYFFPDQPVPLIFKYVESNDLWKHDTLPHSMTIAEAIATENWMQCSFGVISYLVAHTAVIESPLMQQLIRNGEIAYVVKERIYDRAFKNSRMLNMKVIPRTILPTLNRDGAVCDHDMHSIYKVCVVEDSTGMGSEIGNYIIRESRKKPHVTFDAVVLWRYSFDQDQVIISVRSDQECDNPIDLSWISQHIVGTIPGGGHPGAAGVTIPGPRAHIASVFFTKSAKSPQPKFGDAMGKQRMRRRQRGKGKQ